MYNTILRLASIYAKMASSIEYDEERSERKLESQKSLQEYLNDSSLHFHYAFTDNVHKELRVIMHPRNSSSPIGVYTYDAGMMKSGYDTFGNERPYIYVLRPKVELLDLASVTQSQVNDFKAKIASLVGNEHLVKADKYIEKYTLSGNLPKAVSTPGGELYYIVSKAHKQEWKDRDEEFSVSWSQVNPVNPIYTTWLFKQLGIEGLRDTQGIIYSSEPYQCVFFSTSGFDLVDIIRNPHFKRNKIVT